jgi:transposase
MGMSRLLHLVDRRTGEEIPLELFVAVLGASNYTYAEAIRSQKLGDWVGVHTRMAEYFGGSTRLWVPDQLKSAVTKPCRYEPDLNRTNQELVQRRPFARQGLRREWLEGRRKAAHEPAAGIVRNACRQRTIAASHGRSPRFPLGLRPHAV